MTDTTTEPVAHPAATAPPPEPPPPPRERAQTPATQSELAHTPGGIPVLPLALSSANGAVGAVSTVALVGGGPVALAVAAGGAAVLGATAAIRARRRTNGDSNGGRSTSPNRRGGTGRTTRTPSTSRSRGGSGPFSGSRGRGGGAKSRTGSGAGKSGLRSGGAGRLGGRHPSRSGTSRSGTGRHGTGRIGQARALRQITRKQAPTRSAARQQNTAARRAVADARRDARTAARARKAAGSRGTLRRAGGWAAGKAAAGSRALVNKARAARDRNTGAQVDAKRGQVRKAPARRKARWGLLKSAARFQGRRLLAAVAGGALGLLGCLTTPLGKKLGWSWLIHPGRRLYRRLLLSAREKRAARDEQIRATRAAEEAAADVAGTGEIGDRVARPARIIPTAPTAASEVINVSGFKFEDAAADMENAARSYEPDGNMEVLAMIDNLPTALLSVANTFRILAERSDGEFAFEKDVAAGFDDIHQTLLNAVDAAETLVPLFRTVHAQDIARHEDPRNGTEAEKGWNV
ncbi:hypothetical protein AB0D37_42730 [Streptomyces sp. NPDC048384]|uniref:hypothetical protein n=1 Tax=Streptomyces sp. NPDC048384 TaxID=3155487 RepID=UPI0034336C4A